jgi:hypothetical protein
MDNNFNFYYRKDSNKKRTSGIMGFRRYRLVVKHPMMKDLLDDYTDDNIIDEYSKYPDFHILTHKIDNVLVSKNRNDKLKQKEIDTILEVCKIDKGIKDNKKII